MSTPTVLVFGEALADVFPDRAVLGGAPFNLARHLAQLGMNTHLMSATGRDELAIEIESACKAAGVRTEWISQCSRLPTGKVLVKFESTGKHHFEIEADSAWDDMHFPGMQALQQAAPQVLVYGTLALRKQNNRDVLLNVMQHTEGLRVCDFNWRAGHISIDAAIGFARMADWLKLSDEEFLLIANALGTSSSNPEQIRQLLGVKCLVVTYGEQGSLFVSTDQQLHATAVSTSQFIDSVGAGDSFLAALLASHLCGHSIQKSMGFAARFAASICEVRGAVPSNPEHYQPFLNELQS